MLVLTTSSAYVAVISERTCITMTGTYGAADALQQVGQRGHGGVYNGSSLLAVRPDTGLLNRFSGEMTRRGACWAHDGISPRSPRIARRVAGCGNEQGLRNRISIIAPHSRDPI
jgi:hypothetical protein